MYNVYDIAFKSHQKQPTKFKEEVKEVMGVLEFKKQFKTIHMDFGRCTGKTSFALSLLKSRDLYTVAIVTPTDAMADYLNDTIHMQYLTFPCVASLDTFIFKKEAHPQYVGHYKDFDIVIVDEPGFLSTAKLDAVYGLLGHDNTTYIYLGRGRK